MKPLRIPSMLLFGALVLFGSAFAGFAHLRGVPAQELPVLGALFRTPAKPPREGMIPAPVKIAVTPRVESSAMQNPLPLPPRRAPSKTSVLDVFKLESPFTAAQLRELVETLRQRERQAEDRLDAAARKESQLAEREVALQDQQRRLLEMRAQLERMQSDLRTESAVLAQQLLQHRAIEDEAWRTRGRLFEEGEPELLAPRLATYAPEEAAQVLATLEPDRARDLLDALPAARWRDFAEAYALRVARPTAKP
jgi:hypothetical protein